MIRVIKPHCTSKIPAGTLERHVHRQVFVRRSRAHSLARSVAPLGRGGTITDACTDVPFFQHCNAPCSSVKLPIPHGSQHCFNYLPRLRSMHIEVFFPFLFIHRFFFFSIAPGLLECRRCPAVSNVKPSVAASLCSWALGCCNDASTRSLHAGSLHSSALQRCSPPWPTSAASARKSLAS